MSNVPTAPNPLGPSATAATRKSQGSTVASIPSNNWKIKLLYDSECPLCMREVRLIQKRDRGRGLVQLVDIADLNYTPAEHGGITYEAAMGRIHGILPDGTILRDIAVFRAVYEIIGLGWVYAITRIQGIEALLNGVYRLWAKSRLTLTGRPPLPVILAERQTCKAKENQQRCRLDLDSVS